MNNNLASPHPPHKIAGWAGTAFALTDYAFFAAGALPELWFFGLGAIAAALLAWALFNDRAQYGTVLQIVFVVLNLFGIVRILW